jgi:hypothetical protein
MNWKLEKKAEKLKNFDRNENLATLNKSFQK